MIIIFYDTIPRINYTIIQTQIFSNFASTFQQLNCTQTQTLTHIHILYKYAGKQAHTQQNY